MGGIATALWAVGGSMIFFANAGVDKINPTAHKAVATCQEKEKRNGPQGRGYKDVI